MEPCPPKTHLQSLVDGELDTNTISVVAEHVDTCLDCQSQLAAMTSGSLVHVRSFDAPLPEPNSASNLAFLNELASRGPAASDPRDDAWIDLLSPTNHPDGLGQFSHYVVQAEIGRGGMGIVLRGWDPRLERDVAIKIMRPTLLPRPEMKERFLNEAKMMATIDDPNVTPIYDVSSHDEVPFIVMKWLDGQSLRQRLNQSGPLNGRSLKRLAQQTTSGLQAAHRIGLVHRDIKPSNIFLESPDDHVRLLDFGLARPEDGGTAMTRTNAIVGSPAYMSPEQARGEQVDPRSDWFSLGIVLYEAASGRRPFDGNSTVNTLARLIGDQPEPLNESVPAIDDGFADGVMALLEKSPDQRSCSVDLLLGTVPVDNRPVDNRIGRQTFAVVAGITLLALAIFATVTMTIRTPHGEVAIQLADGIDPNSVEVKLINKGDVYIADSAKGFSVLVREGKYEANLLSDDTRLQLSPRTIVVTKNDVETIQIKLSPAEKTTKSIVMTPLESLRWVLDVGGNVTFDSDPQKVITKASGLPVSLDKVRTISLLGCDIDDADLLNLSGLKSIQQLSLGRKRIQGAITLIDNAKLTRLTDDALVNLATIQPLDLKQVILLGIPVSSSGLQQIAQFGMLEAISISFGNLEDGDLKTLANLKQLNTLAISACGLSGSDLIALKDLPLRKLTIAERGLSSDAVEAMPIWPTLTSLTLNGLLQATLSEKAINSLSKHQQLRLLYLIQFRKQTRDGLLPLGKLTDLDLLGIVNVNGVSDKLVAELIDPMHQLRHLDLRNTSITDQSLQAMANKPSLKRINISSNELISQSAVSDLQNALPHATIISSNDETTGLSTSP